MIYLNGKPLDSALEHEIRAECMTVHINRKADVPNGSETCHGVTEVHWRFSSAIVPPQVAVESDIFSMGQTIRIEHLDSIFIECHDHFGNRVEPDAMRSE